MLSSQTDFFSDSSRSSFYKVERIEDKRIKNGKVEYFVKWENYDHSYNTWEPMRNLRHSSHLLKAYEDNKLQEVIQSELTSSLFDKGWVAKTVLGVVDDMTEGDTKYLVQIKHQRTKERVQKILVPKECGKARRHVELLVEKFNEVYK